MTLSNSDLIAIVGVVATLISAAIGRYGFQIFSHKFWKTKHIGITGELTPLVRFRGQEVVAIASSPHSHQKIEFGKIQIRGSGARIQGRYTAIYDGHTEIVGKFLGSGTFYNGIAYITYEIVDKERSQHTFGTMLLYIQEWGDIFGYFCCKSVRVPGTTGAGSITLKRQNI